ncbi:hypothetical protein LSH36_408g01006 [Paralvinella palmiformis]|uniref:Uncharacterized protein n=1 Tax=Paralvinella palmiformis TaxID=53620 RepID=A0AAD9JDG5_9ANNE|nr:hypothetical protein LSH36_408g01006 [Paralvinella palmiformis]
MICVTRRLLRLEDIRNGHKPLGQQIVNKHPRPRLA